MMSPQSTVDGIRLSIIKKRKLKISLLEKKRDNLNEEIQEEKEYLKAYQKTIPTVEVTN